MKIVHVALQDFRAFPGSFDLPLNGGCNLLLHGENGSGKSSLALALQEFLSLAASFPRPIDSFAHRFPNLPDALGAVRSRQPKVELRFDTANPPEAIAWSVARLHPLQPEDGTGTASTTVAQRERLVGVSQQSGFFDYRALLRSSYLQKGDDLGKQLFYLFVQNLLAAFRPGGGAKTIADIWQEVQNAVPPSRRKGDMRRSKRVTDDFNLKLAPFLENLRVEANRLLNYFPGNRMEIVRLFHDGCQYSKPTKQLIGDRLDLEITYSGLPIPKHEEFLNEARLTALALSMFLAAVKLSESDPASTEQLRVLLLDDVLIGLDLSHRIPLLDILRNEFFNHQLFLFTHDRVWFDIAKGHTDHWGKWKAYGLYTRIAGTTQPEVPQLKGDKNDASMDELAVAQRHLDQDDLRGAAVYIRAAYEEHLQKLCRGIAVSYNPNPLEVKADHLWTALLRKHSQRLKKSKKRYLDDSLLPKISAMRSAVLNRLAHAGLPGLNKPDVQDALNTVRSFRTMRIPFDPDHAPKAAVPAP